MQSPTSISFVRRHAPVKSTCLLIATCLGCGKDSPSASAPEVTATHRSSTTNLSAVEIMEKMVAVYRKAGTYLDNAEYGEHFVLAGEGVQRQGPPITVSVIFARPNHFRITRAEPKSNGELQTAVVACDGEKLEAELSPLPGQRLSLPAPATATVETVAPDPLLRDALFPVPAQDIFPQLALLAATDAETAWPLEVRDKLVLLPAKSIIGPGSNRTACYRVQMPTNLGPQICWIDQANFLLRRIELPSDETREKLYPHLEFSSFVWRFDFYDATVGVELPKDAFHLDRDAVFEQVTIFRERDANKMDVSSGTSEESTQETVGRNPVKE